MTESMRSHDEPTSEPLAMDPYDFESSTAEMSAKVAIGQFLTQCRHAAVEPKEELADFILQALDDKSEDERTILLREQLGDLDDGQFSALLDSDHIFRHIYDLLIRTKTIVGRGEAMSHERKALIKLMELRGGESTMPDVDSADMNDEAWSAVLAKLFPDLM